MDDNKFYIGCWSLATIVFLTICGCITATGILEDRAVVEMVKAGADPLVAACAVSSTDTTNGVCVGVVVKR